MKFLKKFAGAMVICSLLSPYAAFAQTTTEYETAELSSNSRIGADTSDISLSNAPEQLTENDIAILNFIANQFSRTAEEIDITDYKIEAEHFKRIYNTNMGCIIRDEHPEIFYLKNCSISMNMTRVNDGPAYITSIIPKYDYSLDTIKAKQASIDTEVNHIISLMGENMTDLEKVLFVHDYITYNYQYDLRAYDENPYIQEEANHYLDEMVEEKTGVCQGYTNLFMYVMNKLSIPCEAVPSDALNHIWNKVYIDGKWLNVDVTYDDALPDRTANIEHGYFLVTDEHIKELDPLVIEEDGSIHSGHGIWNEKKWDGSDITKSYGDDSAYFNFRKIYGPTVYKDGYFYALDDVNNLCRLVFDNENIAREINTLTAAFGWKYIGFYSTLAQFDGGLYINDGNNIYEYDIEQNILTPVYSYSENNDRYSSHIYGIKVVDNSMNIEFSEDLNDGVVLIPVTLSKPEKPDDPKPDDPVEEPLPELTKVQEVTDAEEQPAIIVSVDIPEEIPEEKKETIKIMVAQYNEHNVLIGFSQVEKEKLSDTVALNENCATVKTFVWSENNTPLSIVSEFLRRLDK